MSEYNLGFSEKLIDAAKVVFDDGLNSVDAARTVIYLGLLSCEITLKSLLERAGMSVKDIKKYSHNLNGLLNAVRACEIHEDIGNGIFKWIPASRLKSLPINTSDGKTVVGKILSAESSGASNYPNEIRYGEGFRHYPPEAIIQTAISILSWTQNHWDRVCITKKQ